MIRNSCPDPKIWRDYLLGQVDDDQESALGNHLEGCEQCLRTLRAIRAEDVLTEAMRQPVTQVDAEQTARFTRLAVRFNQLAHLSQRTNESSGPGCPDEALETCVQEATQQVFDFLRPAEENGELGRLGGYRVLRVIGSGGMGVVFEAEDPRLKRRVALKAVKPSLATSSAAGQRFEREAQAAAAIKHDGIVTIYQVGVDRDVPFLAMELLEGESLDVRVRRDPVLELTDVLRIGREIAEALAVAHENGLIHRDIKPANVWLEKPSGRVKLLDFGLARVLRQDTQITREGAIVGTPAFMAPEQSQGASVDARADLFSLGCILYRMTTGVLPFQESDTIALLLAVGTKVPAPPRQVNPAIPVALSDMIVKLLAKKPADRPPSARAVVETLKKIEQNPYVALPASTSRWRWMFGIAAVAALVVPLWLFGMQIIRFATNMGELIIEIDDPDVVVTIERNRLLLHDKTKERRFTIEAGSGDVRVFEKDGVGPIVTKNFTLNRGGRATVTVTAAERERTKVIVPPMETKKPPEPITPSTPAAKKSRLFAEVRHEKHVYAVGFSKAANCLIAGGAGERAGRNLKFYDAEKGKEIASLTMPGDVATFGMDREGKVLACAGSLKVDDRFVIQIVDSVSRKVIKNIPVERGDVDMLALSPDGHSLAWMNSKTNGTLLHVLDLRTDRQHEEKVSFGTVRHMMFSGDGRYVVVCTHSSHNQSYDLIAKKFAAFHHGKFFFSPDGTFLVHQRGTLYDARESKLWPPEGLHPSHVNRKKEVLQNNGNAKRMEFSVNGRVLAAGMPDDSIHLVNTKEGEEFLSIQPQRWTTFALSPNGRSLALGTATGIIEIWDISPDAK